MYPASPVYTTSLRDISGFSGPFNGPQKVKSNNLSLLFSFFSPLLYLFAFS